MCNSLVPAYSICHQSVTFFFFLLILILQAYTIVRSGETSSPFADARMVAGNTEMPDAIETVFQSALAFGRHGGVSTYIISFLIYLNLVSSV